MKRNFTNTYSPYLLNSVYLFIINFLISSLFFLMRYKFSDSRLTESPMQEYLITQLNFQVLAFAGVYTGTSCHRIFRNRPLLIQATAGFLSALASVLTAFFPVVIIASLIRNIPRNSLNWPEIYVSQFPEMVLITFIFTAVIALHEKRTQYNRENRGAAGRFDDRSAEFNAGKQQFLTIRVDSDYRRIEFKDIIYVSAHRNRCVLHLKNGEFLIPKGIGRMMRDLPASLFVQIHKSYIVNQSNLLSMRYSGGGGYIVTLNDGDDTSLPVGRNYANSLRRHLQI